MEDISKSGSQIAIERQVAQANSPEAETKRLEAQLGDFMSPDPKDIKTKEEKVKKLMDESTTLGENLMQIPAAIAGGSLDAVQETYNFGVDVLDSIDNAVSDNGEGFIDPTKARTNFAESWVPEEYTNTPLGRFTRGVTQFGVGMVGAGKFLRAFRMAPKVGKIGSLAVPGMAADFVAFDPDEKNLANWVADNWEMMDGVAGVLAADDVDLKDQSGRFTNRFKTALVGFGAGAMAEVPFGIARFYKAKRAGVEGMDRMRMAMGEQAEMPGGKPPAEATMDEKANPKWAEGKGSSEPTAENWNALKKELDDSHTELKALVDEEKAIKKAGKITPEISDKLSDIGVRKEVVGKRILALDDNLSNAPSMKPKLKEVPPTAEMKATKEALTPKEVQTLRGSVKSMAETVAKYGYSDSAVEAAHNVIKSMDSVDDLPKAIKDLEDMYGKQMVAPEKVTAQDLEMLSEAYGIPIDDLVSGNWEAITRDRRKIFAAVTFARASVRHASESKRVFMKTGADVDKLILKDAVHTMRLAVPTSANAGSELGRKLNIVKQAQGGHEKDKFLMRKGNEMIKLSNNSDDELLERVLQDKNFGSDSDFIKLTKFGQMAKLGGMISNIIIGGMVTRTKTSLTNLVSGGLMTVTGPVEKLFGAGVSKIRGSGYMGVTITEATAGLHAMPLGLHNGIRAAAKTLATGKTSAAVKYGFSKERINLEQLDPIFKPFGALLNYAAAIVDTANRPLFAGDELIRGITGQMGLEEMASRKAIQKAKGDPDLYDKYFSEYMEKPDGEMLQAAHKAGADATLTNPLTGFMGDLEKAIRGAPGLRLLLPFTRVATNMTGYVAERTPVALVTPRFARVMREGSRAEQDLAIGKILFGTSIFGALWPLYIDGTITGREPVEPASKKLFRGMGGKSKALTIGSKSYDISRGEPFTRFMTLGADIARVGAHYDDRALSELVLAWGGALAEAYTPEFILRNIAPIIEGYSMKDERAMERLAGQIGGMAIPGFMKDVKDMVDPFVRDATPDRTDESLDILEALVNGAMKNIVGFSDNLPGDHNIFGETILTTPGNRLNNLSPIQSSKEFGIVENEIVRLGIQGPFKDSSKLNPKDRDYVLDMPSRSMTVSGVGGSKSVPLSPRVYQERVKMSAGIGLPAGSKEALREGWDMEDIPAKEFNLKSALEHEIKKGYPNAPGSGDNKTDAAKRWSLNMIVKQFRKAADAQIQQSAQYQNELMAFTNERAEVLFIDGGIDPFYDPDDEQYQIDPEEEIPTNGINRLFDYENKPLVEEE